MIKFGRLHRTSYLTVVAVGLAAAGLATAAPSAHAARSCNYYNFVKGTNNNSTLSWRRIDPVSGYCAVWDSWRSGSGTTTNACTENEGWLPGGWYDSWAMTHAWGGTKIHGRVVRIQDKQCNGGTTWRRELFIHTEESDTIVNGTNVQQCSSPYVEAQCWDGDSDYYSDGCIKVGPGTGWTGVDNAWHNQGGPNQHGDFTSTERVFVTS